MPAVTILDTVDLPLDSLIPFPGNARRGDVAKIRESVRKNGQYRSILVRDVGGTRTIVAGNHTAQAMREEGHATARCELIECSDETALAVNLADNRMSDLGGYDDEALVDLLESLGGDFEATGYTEADLEGLLSALEVAETHEALPVEPRPAPEPLAETPSEDRGIRETILLLPQGQHDEFHRHLAQLRDAVDRRSDLTNGELVLKAARTLHLALDVRSSHDLGCICEMCVLVETGLG
jgi:ParB-like chromosome segregation protein Spo0J